MKYYNIPEKKEPSKLSTFFGYLTIFILAVFVFSSWSCSSRQLMETADNQDISIEEDRTEIELDRSKDLIEIIKSLEIEKAIKNYIIKEIEYKDRFLVLKGEKIKSLNSRIKAYQRESSKAVNKCEEKQEEFIQEQKDCLIDAGYGKAFKMIMYGMLAILVLATVIYAMKKGLLGMFVGG